ncbi:MAG TPA: hypothetical protein VGE47_14465, partial [Burkholderiaceae bacterium]
MAKRLEARSLGSQQYRAGWMLIGGVALLLGAGLYLMAQQHGSVRSNAQTSSLEVARGLEASISARFRQSVASLQGLAADLSGDAPSEAAAAVALRNAARYDPFSGWLGLVDSRRGMAIMVDQSGARAAPAHMQALLAQLQ